MYPLINLPTPYPKEYLEALYDYVKEHKPKTIVEFGSGWGSTTIYMRGAQEDGDELYSYESDKEKYEGAVKNFLDVGIYSSIHYSNDDYGIFFDNPIEFDLLYIDVHNEGSRINKIIKNEFIQKMINKGKHILFEGGSDARDDLAISRGGKSFKIIEHEYELVYGKSVHNHGWSKLC
jgi:hypothetical protein|tara:strand:- start:1273 stop:1803 length:531 start_codon:yes stop_codon:yes gene_type:complete